MWWPHNHAHSQEKYSGSNTCIAIHSIMLIRKLHIRRLVEEKGCGRIEIHFFCFRFELNQNPYTIKEINQNLKDRHDFDLDIQH